MKSSSRVNLYLPTNLVESLKTLAKNDERSLNAYIIKILQQHVEDKVPNTPQEPRRIQTPKREEFALKLG